MAYERNDRDFPSRDREDDRQRLTGHWIQDDETGHLQRRFNDDEAYCGRRDQEGRSYDARRKQGEATGSYGDNNHAFDFAGRGSGHPDRREAYRSWEGQDRPSEPEGYGARSTGGFDRSYGIHSGREPSGGRPREGWPEKGNWISRYVSTEGRYPREESSNAPAGSFRGKGPKGYIRPDERIKEDVSDRLSDDETLDASNITVEVADGEVTLSGYVDSRQAKHTAEDCAEQCTGVLHVQNNLRVGNATGKEGRPTRSEAEPTDESKISDF